MRIIMIINKVMIIMDHSHTSHNGISPSTISSPSHLSCLTLVHATWFVRFPALSFSHDGATVGNGAVGVATLVTVKSRTLRFLLTLTLPLLKGNPSFIQQGLSETATMAVEMKFPICEKLMEAMKRVSRYKRCVRTFSLWIQDKLKEPARGRFL